MQLEDFFDYKNKLMEDILTNEYTIVAESNGAGATKWGKLKSGAGWISLDYCKKL